MIVRILLVVMIFSPVGIVQLCGQNLPPGEDLEVRLVVKGVRSSANELTLDLSVENLTKSTIYICVNPKQLYGPEGHYFKFQDTEASFGLISCRVYPEAPFYSPIDATSVKLRSVLPLQKYDLQLKIVFPIKETFPPFDGGLKKQKKTIKRSDIRKLTVEIGYFIEKEVVEIANRRVNGAMSVKLAGGREASLLELQKLLLLDIPLN